MSRYTVGTSTIGYAEKRNFCDLPFEKYSFKKLQNLHKIPAHWHFKTRGTVHEYYWFSFKDLDLNRVDLLHFFNTLSYGKRPWLCTFETTIPRWGDNTRIKEGLELISRDACVGIIALSECAAQMQRNLVAANFPEYSEMIERKLMVLHPAQPALIQSYAEKELSETITFTLIGSDFFRKGGMEVLKAFDRLFEEGVRNWQLNIISTLDFGDYASKATESDKSTAMKIIARYPENINHFQGLENSKVLELLKSSHVGLLPTYADSYGYSVLESQACGCPCITTDIRALPEINNPKVGWVIEVPKKKNGNGLIQSDSERVVFSRILADGLYSIIKDILSNRDSVKKKGIKALERIKTEHSIEKNTQILENIYDEILKVKT